MCIRDRRGFDRMSLKGLINFFNLDGMDEEDEFENYVDD